MLKELTELIMGSCAALVTAFLRNSESSCGYRLNAVILGHHDSWGTQEAEKLHLKLLECHNLLKVPLSPKLVLLCFSFSFWQF